MAAVAPPPSAPPPAPYAQPGPPPPVALQVQHLPAEVLPKIEEWLKEELDRAFLDREKLERKWGEWLKQYDGRLERNDSPATWQSRLDFATTRKHLQHVGARLTNPFFNQEHILTAKPRTPEYDELSRKLDLLFDYLFDRFDAQQFTSDCVQDHMVYGYSAAKVLFVNKQTNIADWGVDPLTQLPTEVAIQVPDEVGAIPQRICPSDMIWPSYARDQAHSPWIGDRFYLTYDDIAERIEDPATAWYQVLDQLSCTEDIDPVTRVREELTGVKPSEKRYEFIEVYVNRFPSKLGLPKGTKAVVTINRQSGKAVRAIVNYYHRYQDPYVLLYWQKLPNSMDANSLCYYLEPYHRAISATVCMELDAASLAVKGRFPYTNDQQVAEQIKNQTRALGDLVQGTTPANEAITMIELYQEPPTNLTALRQETKVEAEQIANLNPYNRGEEQSQRPTASGQTLLVEQGLEPIKERLEKVRSWMVRLGMVMLARVKQFHQNYVEFSTYVDQKIIPMTITLPPGLIEDKVLVEPMASSSTMNEAVRQQQIIGLVDRMTQAYQTMTTMADMGAQQAMMGSPTAMIYAGFLQGYQYLIDRLLTEFKVPNKEIINPPVDAMQAMGQMLIMGAQQALMGPPPGAAPPPGATDEPTPDQP